MNAVFRALALVFLLSSAAHATEPVLQPASGASVPVDLSTYLEGGICNNDVAICTNVTGTALDYTCASGTDCIFGSSGANPMILRSGSGAIHVTDSGGTVRAALFIGNGYQSLWAMIDGVSAWMSNTAGMWVGTRVNSDATETVGGFAEVIASDFASTNHFEVYGEGTLRAVPRDALVITATTDTTSTPLGALEDGAGTACRMSSSGVSNWTPSETGAVDGMWWCCTNTGANAITMTDSDGVYEGPGSVVGQWDQVCFEYVGTRFVERSFSNNEP